MKNIVAPVDNTDYLLIDNFVRETPFTIDGVAAEYTPNSALWNWVTGGVTAAPVGAASGGVTFAIGTSPTDFLGVDPAAKITDLRGIWTLTTTAISAFEIGIASDLASGGVTNTLKVSFRRGNPDALTLQAKVAIYVDSVQQSGVVSGYTDGTQFAVPSAAVTSIPFEITRTESSVTFKCFGQSKVVDLLTYRVDETYTGLTFNGLNQISGLSKLRCS